MDTKKQNNLSNNVTQICESFNMLASNIDKIDRKIEDITKIFYKLSYNATLESSDTNSFLKFQIELLNVEKIIIVYLDIILNLSLLLKYMKSQNIY